MIQIPVNKKEQTVILFGLFVIGLIISVFVLGILGLRWLALGAWLEAIALTIVSLVVWVMDEEAEMLYKYTCSNCGFSTDRASRIVEKTKVKCPQCGAEMSHTEIDSRAVNVDGLHRKDLDEVKHREDGLMEKHDGEIEPGTQLVNG